MHYDPQLSVPLLIAEIERLLNVNGYYAEIRHDFENWVAFLEDGQKMRMINPSFDPRHSTLTPDSSFWIQLLDEGGHAIACDAYRIYQVQDFAEHIRTLKFIYDRVPNDMAPLTLSLPSDTPVFGGRVGHAGGMWIDPQHRKRGLPFLLTRMKRAIAMLRFDPDWECGLLFGDLAATGIQFSGYGYTRSMLCFDCHHPATSRRERAFLTAISREEMRLQIHHDATTIVETPSDDMLAFTVCRKAPTIAVQPTSVGVVGM